MQLCSSISHRLIIFVTLPSMSFAIDTDLSLFLSVQVPLVPSICYLPFYAPFCRKAAFSNPFRGSEGELKVPKQDPGQKPHRKRILYIFQPKSGNEERVKLKLLLGLALVSLFLWVWLLQGSRSQRHYHAYVVPILCSTVVCKTLF